MLWRSWQAIQKTKFQISEIKIARELPSEVSAVGVVQVISGGFRKGLMDLRHTRKGFHIHKDYLEKGIPRR